MCFSGDNYTHDDANDWEINRTRKCHEKRMIGQRKRFQCSKRETLVIKQEAFGIKNLPIICCMFVERAATILCNLIF